jgi:molybdenum cofactor guanylyltransferase
MHVQRDNITAIILAGGQGRRFQYRDKGLIEWQQKTLVEHVIHQLQPQVGQIIISCNRNIERYEELGFPCVTDKIDGFQGPLAGLQAALPHVQTKYCLTCPCDSPVLPENLVATLFSALSQQQADLAYIFDGERKQYLLAIMKTGVKDSLNNYLTQQDRQVRAWQQQLKAIEVDFSEQQGEFLNINSPDEFSKATKNE